MSDTQKLIDKLNEIILDSSQGYNFKELWDKLESSDKALKAMMYNDKGGARVGLLQGILNRIKAHKLPNLYYNNSDKCVYFSQSDTTMLKQLTKRYRSEVENLIKPIEKQQLTNKQTERIEQIQNLIGELSNEVGKLPLNLSRTIKKKEQKEDKS